MTKFKKALSGLLTLSTAVAMTGLGLVSTAHGAQLTNASVRLTDPRPTANTTYQIKFNNATAGNVRQVQFEFSVAASGGAVRPNNFDADGATLTDLTFSSDTEANWSITDITDKKLITLERTGSAISVAQHTMTVDFGGIISPDLTSGCDAVANSESCFVRIRTYTDQGVTLRDSTTVTFTVTTATTVTATVDPILTFTLAGVDAATISSNDSNVGTGTGVTTTATTVPFGNVTVGTAKMGQQRLNTLTNSNNGYIIYGKFVTGSGQVMIGNASASNNIDKFGNGSSWATPTAWAAPNGTSANVNSAWLGVRTSDTDVNNFNSPGVYAPPDVDSDALIGQEVMKSAISDDGTTSAFVTFKIQANAFQPADSYSGTWVYNVVASY